MFSWRGDTGRRTSPNGSFAEGGNIAGIEGAINRLHLWDIFVPANEIEVRALEHMAEVIAASWGLLAQRNFPDRKFVAAVTDDYGPTVVLRSGSASRA